MEEHGLICGRVRPVRQVSVRCPSGVRRVRRVGRVRQVSVASVASVLSVGNRWNVVLTSDINYLSSVILKEV